MAVTRRGAKQQQEARRLKRTYAMSKDGDTESLTERTYQLLRRDILSCVLEPGREVSEAELAEHLSVSKTPVREALGRLRLEGFVKTFPRRGYQIMPLTLADMEELFDVRKIIDGGCGELAAERITDDELDRLDALASASYDRKVMASLDQFVSTNRDFHLAIARASGSAKLHELVAKQLDELERFFYLGARIRDLNTEVSSDHHKIVKVLRSRDPGAARRVMIEHNEATRRGLLEGIATSSLRRLTLDTRTEMQPRINFPVGRRLGQRR
jgi:DNA-binding GntR family transcriptional regulator